MSDNKPVRDDITANTFIVCIYIYTWWHHLGSGEVTQRRKAMRVWVAG